MACDEHSLIADVAVIADSKVLLVRYADSNKCDHEPGWFLPDDAVRPFEHPDRAALRIANEQLGVHLPAVRLSHLESFKGNDGSWHLPFHYVAELRKAPALKPSKDVSAAAWYDLEHLPPKGEVAHHGWALSVLARILEDK